MATQNPIESEGTYPLPEAQVDRFMMKVVVGYPTAREESVVVERSLRPSPEVLPILTADGLAELQEMTAEVYVDRAIVDYAVALTTATREPETVGLAEGQAVHRVRRQPARLDQPRPRGPRPGGRPRPPLRHPDRRDRARPRRPPPPRRAELHGARRGSHGRHDPRPLIPAVPMPAGSPSRATELSRRDRGAACRRPGRGRARRQPGPGPDAGGAAPRARRDGRAPDPRPRCPGEFRAHDLGGGTELAQVRPYEPGDDVRQIDWNVTARTTVPHVRVHVPERALTSWLLLDVSPSMTFGTADRRKADVAEGVALAFGHLAHAARQPPRHR